MFRLFSAVAILTIGMQLPAAQAAGEKKPEPAKATDAATSDAWATKFGDLGPAYAAAAALARDAKYDDAIKALNALGKPDDPRVLNWIGFSLRKSGKVAEAMPYYDKALAKAPDFTPAHEYLGEAYLQMKDAAKAKDQLAQIEKLCGNQTCDEYKDLSEAIIKSAL